MDFELKTLDAAGAAAEKADALVVLVAQDAPSAKGALAAMAADAARSGDFEPKPGKLLSAWKPAGVAAPRVVFAGIGDGSARYVRQAVTGAIGAIKGGPSRSVVVLMPAGASGDALQAAVLAVADASYVYTATKSKPEPRKLQRVVLGVTSADDMRPALVRARATASGIEFAKEWANRPGNLCTPSLLADAAKGLSRQYKAIGCEVLGPKDVAKLGMGSFMGVAKGSEEELRFIVLRYDGVPARGKAGAPAPCVLVGKGITFDTGGISIKPAAEMDEMKFDMCGAASVLGVFRALAELRPAVNVVGLIPTCENMPDGRAVKPGDVLTSMSGQTIEVLNTDAEGRLILCDALTYAERFKPQAVVDIATLTGACVIALGAVRSGLFSTDDALATALQSAGEASLDLCWRMPLDDEYAEGLKTNFADVANVGGRAGGAITAAKFLQRFAGKFPWAHLDIAGSAWKSGAAKGATGRPVGLLLSYLLSREVGGAGGAAAGAPVPARPAKPPKTAKAPKGAKAGTPKKTSRSADSAGR